MLLAAASAILTLALADCDDITATAAGDLFLACHSASDKFKVPVAGQKAGKNDEMDGYVIRLGKDAHEVVYVTRMGGSGYDLASRVAIDARGNAWVAGFTKSADFAVTADAWQKTYGGGDGFVQRGPDKRVTFGGSGEEKLTGLAHHKGKLWAAGYTRSNDWKALRGGSDAFAVRLNARTLAIEKTEYFGGSGDDPAWGIAVNKRGRVFIAGQTSSHDLPGAGSGYQRANRGEVDSFIARIGGGATYFGGTAKDEAGYDGQNIAIDAQGNVWMAGMTYSADLPAEGAYGGGDGDGFIAKFAPSLQKILFASYAGSPARELGEGIAILPQGGAAMTMVRFGGADGIRAGPFFAESLVTFWR